MGWIYCSSGCCAQRTSPVVSEDQTLECSKRAYFEWREDNVSSGVYAVEHDVYLLYKDGDDESCYYQCACGHEFVTNSLNPHVCPMAGKELSHGSGTSSTSDQGCQSAV